MWLGDTPLLDQVVHPLLPMESWEMVSAYWEQGREWRWEELSCLLPMHTLNTLRCKVLHENEYSDDGYCWGPTLDGSFSVKTTYSLVQPSLHRPCNSTWNIIWKLKTTHRIQTFVWALYHARMMTNQEQCRRGFTFDLYCDSCSSLTEDLNHIFRFCKDDVPIWEHFLSSSQIQLFGKVLFPGLD